MLVLSQPKIGEIERSSSDISRLLFSRLGARGRPFENAADSFVRNREEAPDTHTPLPPTDSHDVVVQVLVLRYSGRKGSRKEISVRRQKRVDNRIRTGDVGDHLDQQTGRIPEHPVQVSNPLVVVGNSAIRLTAPRTTCFF